MFLSSVAFGQVFEDEQAISNRKKRKLITEYGWRTTNNKYPSCDKVKGKVSIYEYVYQNREAFRKNYEPKDSIKKKISKKEYCEKLSRGAPGKINTSRAYVLARAQNLTQETQEHLNNYKPKHEYGGTYSFDSKPLENKPKKKAPLNKSDDEKTYLIIVLVVSVFALLFLIVLFVLGIKKKGSS